MILSMFAYQQSVRKLIILILIYYCVLVQVSIQNTNGFIIDTDIDINSTGELTTTITLHPVELMSENVSSNSYPFQGR